MNTLKRVFRLLPFVFLAATFGIGAVGADEVSGAGEPVRSGSAEDSRFSIGFAVGDPSSLNLAVAIDPRFSVRGLLGWDLLSPGGPVAALDLLIHFREVKPFGVPLRPYVGGGVKATFLAGDGRFGDSSAETGFSLRVPLGLGHSFDPWPMEGFVEFAPGIRVYPAFAFDPDVALGALIHF
jgi:hypothetical protein